MTGRSAVGGGSCSRSWSESGLMAYVAATHAWRVEGSEFAAVWIVQGAGLAKSLWGDARPHKGLQLAIPTFGGAHLRGGRAQSGVHRA